jgi:protein phosphatase
MRGVIEAYGATDVGRKRDRNEDSFLIDRDLGLFVVADGMGGHAGGGIASRLAVDTIQSVLAEAKRASPQMFQISPTIEEGPAKDRLREAVEAACARIFQEAQANPPLLGMGTTVTSALVLGRHIYLGHVGDSRCYLVRRGRIFQISEDHSLVNEQLKAGAMTPDEARHSRFRNIITRSVGFEEEVLVDLVGIEAEDGDQLILCCDGLTNLVEDDEILEVVDRTPLADVPKRLIAIANDRGGDDNITVIAVRLG